MTFIRPSPNRSTARSGVDRSSAASSTSTSATVVEALTSDASGGLTWLGDNTIASGRDIMHFDMRGVGPIKKIVKSVYGTATPLGGD